MPRLRHADEPAAARPEPTALALRIDNIETVAFAGVLVQHQSPSRLPRWHPARTVRGRVPRGCPDRPATCCNPVTRVFIKLRAFSSLGTPLVWQFFDTS